MSKPILIHPMSSSEVVWPPSHKWYLFKCLNFDTYVVIRIFSCCWYILWSLLLQGGGAFFNYRVHEVNMMFWDTRQSTSKTIQKTKAISFKAHHTTFPSVSPIYLLIHNTAMTCWTGLELVTEGFLSLREQEWCKDMALHHSLSHPHWLTSSVALHCLSRHYIISFLLNF